MIGEIFITRILIVSLIIYIISSYNSKDLVEYYNKKINSKNKEIIKYAKRQKKNNYLIFMVIFNNLSICSYTCVS